MSTKKIKKIKELWDKYEGRLMLFTGVLLVGTISFQLGILQGQKWQQEPLVIEKVSEAQIADLSRVLGESAVGDLNKEVASATVAVSNNEIEKCVFVGSKNSNKYHKKDCSYVGRIKEENQVCFTSEEDAKSKGYVQAGCCFK